jgi:hypothetical protein
VCHGATARCCERSAWVLRASCSPAARFTQRCCAIRARGEPRGPGSAPQRDVGVVGQPPIEAAGLVQVGAHVRLGRAVVDPALDRRLSTACMRPDHRRRLAWKVRRECTRCDGDRRAEALGDGAAIPRSTRGLMELTVLDAGLELGARSPTLFARVVIRAVATTVATTPVLARLRSLAPSPNTRPAIGICDHRRDRRSSQCSRTAHVQRVTSCTRNDFLRGAISHPTDL